MITLSRPRCAVSRLAVVGGVREGLGVALVPVDFVVEPESAFAAAAAESTGMVTVAGFNVSIAASVAPVVSAGVSRRAQPMASVNASTATRRVMDASPRALNHRARSREGP